MTEVAEPLRVSKSASLSLSALFPNKIGSARQRGGLCLDSNPGGGNVIAKLIDSGNQLCLDSNPGGGNVNRPDYLRAYELCLDSNPGGGNVAGDGGLAADPLCLDSNPGGGNVLFEEE